MLSQGDEDVLLKTLEHAVYSEVVDAISNLKMFSDRLVDWLVSDARSHLISDGKWPIYHVRLICEKTAVALAVDKSFHKNASKLSTLLVSRVHSTNFKISEHEELAQAMSKLVEAFGTCCDCDLDLALHTVVQTGNVDQRIRVLRMLHGAKIPFDFESFISFDNLGLEQRNEPMLLEVMAELNLVSDSLVDWFLNKPLLVTEGGWPMRNVVCICNILRSSGSPERATQLAENVLIRLHSTSFRPAEQEEMVAVLVTLQALLTQLPVVQFLQTGDAGQRMRVLAAAAEAGLVFDTPSLGQLAECLLHENVPKSSQILQKTELCISFAKGRCTYGAACRLAHGHREMVCKKWINSMCPNTSYHCRYQHGESESLLTRVLTEEEHQKSRGGIMFDKLHWKG